MSIIRRSNKPQYLNIIQSTVDDLSISWEAKGLLTYLLGRPDNWKASPAHLAKHGKAGRDKVYKILKELGEAGYIEKRRLVNESTKQVESWEYVVFEVPQPIYRQGESVNNPQLQHPENPEVDKKPHPENPEVDKKPHPENPEVDKKPHPEKPDPDFPDLEKPTLTNTDNKLILNKTNSPHPGKLSEGEFPEHHNNENTGYGCMSIESLSEKYIVDSDRVRFNKMFCKAARVTAGYCTLEDCLVNKADESESGYVTMKDIAGYCRSSINNLGIQSISI